MLEATAVAATAAAMQVELLADSEVAAEEGCLVATKGGEVANSRRDKTVGASHRAPLAAVWAVTW